MLRFVAQLVLWFSGIIAGIFVAKDAPNFPLWQMTFGLVLLIILSLIIWFLTNPKSPDK